MVFIVLDSNVFNLLFDEDTCQKRIDIEKELPPEQYQLCKTRRVGIESEHIKDKKPCLYDFINSFQFKDIQYLGFGNHDDRHQRNDNFESGFAPDNTNQIATKLRNKYNERYPNQSKERKKKANDLYKEEADSDLALHSLLGYIVITCDIKHGKGKKQGYLNIAKEMGGKVIFLNKLARAVKEGECRDGDLRRLIEGEMTRSRNATMTF